VEKSKEVPEVPKPKEIEELDDTPEEVPEATPEQEPQEEESNEDESELSEEDVKEWMKNVATVLQNQEKRIANIEHHLRIDFD